MSVPSYWLDMDTEVMRLVLLVDRELAGPLLHSPSNGRPVLLLLQADRAQHCRPALLRGSVLGEAGEPRQMNRIDLTSVPNIFLPF